MFDFGDGPGALTSNVTGNDDDAFGVNACSVPCHDRALFEILILEGAKRENYRRAFVSFDPREVARFTARDLSHLLADPGILRNRAKIEAVIANARALLGVQREFGTFGALLRLPQSLENLCVRQCGAAVRLDPARLLRSFAVVRRGGTCVAF
jgi:DNA-3-methyladenine glycosylase I